MSSLRWIVPAKRQDVASEGNQALRTRNRDMMGQHRTHSPTLDLGPICQRCVTGQDSCTIGPVGRNTCGAEKSIEELALRARQQGFAVGFLGHGDKHHEVRTRRSHRRDPGCQAAFIKREVGKPPVAKCFKVRRPVFARASYFRFWRGGSRLDGWLSRRQSSGFVFARRVCQPRLRLIGEDGIDPRFAPPVERSGNIGRQGRGWRLDHRTWVLTSRAAAIKRLIELVTGTEVS